MSVPNSTSEPKLTTVKIDYPDSNPSSGATSIDGRFNTTIEVDKHVYERLIQDLARANEELLITRQVVANSDWFLCIKRRSAVTKRERIAILLRQLESRNREIENLQNDLLSCRETLSKKFAATHQKVSSEKRSKDPVPITQAVRQQRFPDLPPSERKNP